MIAKDAAPHSTASNCKIVGVGEVQQIKPPFIVFWGFNHFLVVEGFKNNLVFLNDPAIGHRTIHLDEFSEKFTGIVLTFQKSPEYKPTGQKPSFIPALVRRLRNQKLALSFLVFTGFGLIIPGILLPTFTQVFIDNYLVKNMTKWLLPLLIGLLLLAVIRGALAYLQAYFLLRFRMKLSLTSSSKFLWHILHLPLVFFSHRSSGDIAQRMEINDMVANLLSNQLIATILNIVTVTFFVTLMFVYSPELATICITIALLNLVMFRYINPSITRVNKSLALDWGKLFGITMNGLSMIETYKATGNEGNLFSRWSGQFAKVSNLQQDAGVVVQLLFAGVFFLSNLNTIVVLGFGSFLIAHGKMTVGTLVAFQGLLLSFSEPFFQLIFSGSLLQQMHGNMNRLDDVLNYKSLPIANTNANDVSTKLTGKIMIQNISFGYNKFDKALITDFSLEIKPSQRIGIIGAGSNSGKSTIAKLILGLYTPWSGQILFDNIPREKINNSVIAGTVAYVSQDIRLFEGSIRENITLWDTTISEEKMITAAKDAAIHNLISSRDGGYDSMVLENGRNFSGGECQRLEIARSLSIDPLLLILDEATSALDPIVEEQIMFNIKQRKCACLIIANRLSTIRDCDEIIVLDKGQIVQRGTHAQLINNTDGVYYNLVNIVQDTQ